MYFIVQLTGVNTLALGCCNSPSCTPISHHAN